MNERKVGGQKVGAANDARLGAEAFGKPDRRLLERLGAEHIRRRIDEIAAERDRRGNPLGSRRIDPFGRDEPGLGRPVGLEAGVAVESEKKSERGETAIGRRIGEAIDPLRQGGRELAGRKRIARGRIDRIDPEQDAQQRPALARNELQRAGLRLEAAAFGEDRGRSADRGLHPRPVFGADEPDRDGAGSPAGRKTATVGLHRSGALAAPYHGFDRPSACDWRGRALQGRQGAAHFAHRGGSRRAVVNSQAAGRPLVTQRVQLAAASCWMVSVKCIDSEPL